jgi:hypothetical protein
MNQNRTKFLILGLLTGMTLEQIKPFFLSLEKTGYCGDVCMIVADLEQATLNFLRARRINLVPFQKKYLKPKWARRISWVRLFMKPWQQRRFDEQMALTYLHFWCARTVYYRTFLAECGNDYDQVMLADVRDILFQRDPFDFEIPAGLGVFMEDANQSIGTNFSNSTWLREGFGEAVLNELAHKRIYCAGTIFGTPAALQDYLDQVLDLYHSKKNGELIDQAAFNYLLHKQPPKVWCAFENETGPVLTMANMKSDQFHFDAQGFMVNAAGRVFNTLHQYDRHPELAPKLIQRLT